MLACLTFAQHKLRLIQVCGLLPADPIRIHLRDEKFSRFGGEGHEVLLDEHMNEVGVNVVTMSQCPTDRIIILTH